MVATATEANDIEALLDEIGGAETAPEPGGLSIREILHRGDEDLPAAMVTSALTSAGYAFIWDTKTHERHICNKNMLADAIKNKRRPDGSAIFTTRRPKEKPVMGQVKCLLHPDGPNRKQYDEMGMPVCDSGHLINQFELRRHMQNRHKTEWQTIQDEEARAEKQLDNEFKKLLLEQVATKTIRR